MTATLIYVIIIMGCISISACLYCAYMSFLCVKAGKRALPSMRDVSNWQAERQRMIQENRRLRQNNANIEELQRELDAEDAMLRRDELRR